MKPWVIFKFFSEKSSLFEGDNLSINLPTGDKVFGGREGGGGGGVLEWVSGCQAPILKHLL